MTPVQYRQSLILSTGGRKVNESALVLAVLCKKPGSPR